MFRIIGLGRSENDAIGEGKWLWRRKSALSAANDAIQR